MTSLRGPAKRLTVVVDESGRHRPLCTEIVHRAHTAGLIGARGGVLVDDVHVVHSAWRPAR
jgi:hypothetical protein